MKMRPPPAVERLTLDWLVPAIIFGVGVWNVSHHPHSTSYPGSPSEHLVFLGVAVVALGLRRRAPLAAPLAAMAVTIWWSALMWPDDAQGPFEGFVVLVASAYSLGVLNTGRRLLVAACAILVGFVGGEVILLSSGGRDGDLMPVAVWLVAAFGIGYLLNRRTEQARRARRATEMLAADQERQTARAIEDERARIARELHDVVAHGLSVIVVQAGAERRSLHNGSIDAASVDSVLGSIERSGREALVDLRRLLGLLRRSDEPAALAPQPGLGQLEDLLAPVREAGVDVELKVTGDRPELPPALDLTAYRIVQEALTNVLKHANARRVRVALAFRRTDLELDVRDDGVASAQSQLTGVGSGHGLIGMRERASLFGGAVTTGAAPEGGWSVHARLPLSTSGAP